MVTPVAPQLPNFGDRFRVERELGRGGMATVFLCVDTKFDRKVAIKVLHPDLTAAVGAERFHREIKIATGLTHPNILPAYDSGEANGSLYYVMPFVQGESLRDRLNRERQLPVQDAIRITTEISSALQYAHSNGIVHRDIKPENILLDADHAVLADFGIARAISSDVEALTQTGMSLGTPAYMSPEQALGERTLDGRSDQYALACVTYEMLAGQPPFVASTMQALVAKHLGETVPLITTTRPAVPDELEDVILRALEKVPADRFASMQEFSDALNGVIAVTGTWARRGSGGTPGRATPMRSTRAHRAAPVPQSTWSRGRQIAVAVAVLVVLGASLVASKQWRRGQTADIRQMGTAALGLEPRRIAVEYFSDVSATKQYSEIAAGLTEGLIDRLAEVQDLDVVSRSAVSRFRDVAVSRDSVARAFKAGYLVEGSVTNDGPNVRVTVKLVDGSGIDLESASFTQPAGKTLALRDATIGRVTDWLRTRIGTEMRVNARRREANNDAAWLLVQQADRLRRNADDAAAAKNADAAIAAYTQADSLLAQAESLDRDWPEPTIQRSFVAYRRARATAVPSEKIAMFRTAMAHADRLIARDPQNPQYAGAYEYRGSALYLLYAGHLISDPREADSANARAIRDLETSTSLNRRNATAWMTLSTMYANVPAFADSKLAATEAYRSDPFGLNAANILDRLYRTSYITETFNDADKWCTEGRTRFPADPRFLECSLWTYTIAEIRPRPSIDTVWLLADSIQKLATPARREFMKREAHVVAGIVLGRLNMPDSAKRVLDRIVDTPKDADPEGDLLYYNAYARLTLQDKKTAIALLKTYLVRNPEHRAGWGKDSAWWWRDLKKDPEFQRLIATGT